MGGELGGGRVEELIESIKSSSNLKPPPCCKQMSAFPSPQQKKKKSLFSEDTVLKKLWCYWVGVTKNRGEVST